MENNGDISLFDGSAKSLTLLAAFILSFILFSILFSNWDTIKSFIGNLF